jgi:hypothetical protein
MRLVRLAKGMASYDEAAIFARGFAACMHTGRWTVMPHEWKHGMTYPHHVGLPSRSEWLRLRHGTLDSNSIAAGGHDLLIVQHDLIPQK